MPLNVNANLNSLIAASNLGKNEALVQRSIGRLSSGLRIYSAADDAAGLSISEKMRARLKSLTQAQRNANDGISFSNSADGGLREISGMLSRMRELAIQSLNGMNGTNERNAMNSEFQALKSEIDRIANTTEFNGVVLLNIQSNVAFQVGAGTGSNHQIQISKQDANATALGIDTAAVATTTDATTAVASIDTAINSVNQYRGAFGAAINRLTATVASLGDTIQATTSAESQVRSLDVAYESAEFTRLQVLQQAGAAVLAQANQTSQIVLQLFR